jgi:hypothetical protein
MSGNGMENIKSMKIYRLNDINYIEINRHGEGIFNNTEIREYDEDTLPEYVKDFIRNHSERKYSLETVGSAAFRDKFEVDNELYNTIVYINKLW